MSIIKRFADIMSANFNGIIEKFENPEKMIDQYLRNLEKDLGKVKSETADVMVIQGKAEAKIRVYTEEQKKWIALAKKALEENNEEDARQFTEELLKVEDNLAIQSDAVERAKANTEKMLAMHDKLVKDMETLREQRDELMARNAIAKASATVAQTVSSFGNTVGSNIAGYNRMKEKIEDSIKKSEALESLNNRGGSEMEKLAAKYKVTESEKAERVEKRLNELKTA